MIKILSFLFIVVTSNVFSQEISFEQKAFEFYCDSILTGKEPKGSLKICPVVQDFNYWWTECQSKFGLQQMDTVRGAVPEDIPKITLKSDKRFKKVNVFRKGDYPVIFVIARLYFDKKIYVTVVETYAGKGINYLFKMNAEGVIEDWCKGSWTD